MATITRDITACVLCRNLAWSYTMFRLNVRARVVISMPVCASCFQPLPGSDPEHDVAEHVLNSELLALVETFMATHPDLQNWIEVRLEAQEEASLDHSDSTSTEEPVSDDDPSDSESTGSEHSSVNI
jgi:hypothetical protein